MKSASFLFLSVFAFSAAQANDDHDHSHDPVYELDEYTVSAGPKARLISDLAVPSAVMDEAEIAQSGG